MGLFGKSFEEKVRSALENVRGQFPDAHINAQVGDDVVTLTGRAPDMETKTQIMAAFNASVETKNTINRIQVEMPTPHAAGAAPFNTPAAAAPAMRAPAPPPTPVGTMAASAPRTHEVVAGDTLSELAQRYYGDASKYNRIFEANRDQLTDPDKIKIGQRLKIPS